MKWLVMFALMLVTATAVTSASYATAPGKNGKIVFRRYFGANQTRGVVFTISPSGRGERQVTHPGKEATDDAPAWAPDGSRIAFSRQRGRDTAIYTVRPDGSSLTRVSPSCPPKPRCCVGDLTPAFSPNGRDIAFASFDGRLKGAIVISGSDGRNRRIVVPASSSSGLADPGFSPEGDRVLFERENLGRRRPKDARAIFVVNVDGSGISRITPWNLSAGDPDWSADGKWILFGSNEHLNEKSQLYVIHPDGTGLKQLTHLRKGTLGASAAFSPDGRWIVFGASGVGGNLDVYIMRADGTGVRAVTRTRLFDSTADWASAR
jgi:Tol biopolymer transport system component